MVLINNPFFKISFPENHIYKDTLGIVICHFADFKDTLAPIAYQIIFSDTADMKQNPDLNSYICARYGISNSLSNNLCGVAKYTFNNNCAKAKNHEQAILSTIVQISQKLAQGKLIHYKYVDHEPCIKLGREFAISYTENGETQITIVRIYTWKDKYLQISITGSKTKIQTMVNESKTIFESVVIK